MPLPDVGAEDWQSYQADQFGQETDRRIDGFTFSAATQQRLDELNRMAQPAAPQPAQPALMDQNLPESIAQQPPVESPYSAPTPTSPLPTSYSRPPAPTASPLTSAQSGGQDLIAEALNAADRHGLDPHLFVNLIRQESGFNPRAVSPAGAQGLGQLMPATARGLGVTDPNDPTQNLDGAARYLRQNLDAFGGDVPKALAAYNAGPGNVQKYDGVPPFAETQRYVDTIMSKVAQEAIDTSAITGMAGSYAPGPTEGVARAGAALAAAPGRDVSQFGDPQLTADEAYAACGPAAAVRFAQRYGRNPTLKEALDLARTVGWTAQQGMAGLGSEKQLMDKLGVPTKLVQGAAWDVFAKEAQTGNPVTISTAGHYFTADGFNPDTGKFHVGRSGMDLKRGAEWMSPAQMTSLMGEVQGGLLADNPQVPQPSTADQDTNPLNWLGRQKDALLGSIGETANRFTSTYAQGQQELANAGLSMGSNPLETLGGAGLGAPTGGEQLTEQRNQAIAQGNPLRDVPVLGGASTFAAQTALDPTNLLLMGEPAVGRAAVRGAGAAVEAASSPEVQALLRARQRAEGINPLAGLQDRWIANEERLQQGAASLTDAEFTQLSAEQRQLEAAMKNPASVAPPAAPEPVAPADLPPAVGGTTALPETPSTATTATATIPEVPAATRTATESATAQPIRLSNADEIARLRLQDFPEDVRQTISDHAQAIDWARTQRRGVIPDAVAQQMADEYSANHSLDQVIRQGSAGKAYSTEQIRALRNATAAQAVTVNDAAAAVKAGDDSSAMLQKFFIEGEKMQRLVQIAEGARAEAGRSLRAYQDPARLVNLSPNDAVAQITREIGGDRGRLLDAVRQYQELVTSGAGPVQLANFWAAMKNPVGPGDWFRLVRYNSMLSGPRSFEINAVGNALELPWRLARDTGASLIRGRPGEFVVEWNGMFAGLEQANRRFMETLTQGITSEAALRGEIPQSVSARLSTSKSPLAAIGRPVATALEIPSRIMGATDQWAQAIAYNMALGRQAALAASKDGLRGEAWTNRVSQILSDPSTAPKLMQEADAIAQRMTYHGDMGGLGQGLQAFTQKTGVIGNLILPFLKTVYHITARGIDRSPLGLLGTGVDVARARVGSGPYATTFSGAEVGKGVAPLGERFGDNVMGSVIFAGLYLKAADGDISAAGPDDPGRRALLQSEGWQPYSVHVGDKWVSYANWGPAAIPFALAGAASEAQRYAKSGAQPGEIILDGMRRTAQVVQQQTYLQSIGAAWQGLTDPQRYGFQWVNNTIGSLIPYGAAINTVGQATDVYARRPDKFDIGDAIRNRLPIDTPIIGGRESVPTAQDVLGRPMPNTRSGFGAINPLLVNTERADPILQELDRVGLAPPGPPQSVTRNGRQVVLTPDEQRQVQSDAGQVIVDRVGTEIRTASYKGLEPQAQAKRLQRIIDLARTQAENRFVSGLSAAEYQKRIDQSQVKRERVPVSGR